MRILKIDEVREVSGGINIADIIDSLKLNGPGYIRTFYGSVTSGLAVQGPITVIQFAGSPSGYGREDDS